MKYMLIRERDTANLLSSINAHARKGKRVVGTMYVPNDDIGKPFHAYLEYS